MANLNLIPFPIRANFFTGLLSKKIYLRYLTMPEGVMLFFFSILFFLQMKCSSDCDNTED